MSIEFTLLTGEELKAVDPQGVQWPWDTFGIIATEDGKVVGRSAIINMPMIEGTMVVPEKQGGTLAYRLIQKIEELYRELGKTHAIAMVYDEQPEVAEYLKRIGFEKMPVVVYSKTLVEAEKAKAA